MAFNVTAVLKANVSNFTGGIKEAQSVFESFQKKSNRTFENVASGFQKAGLALSAGLTAPTIAGIGAIVKQFSSLEQNLGGTQAVFGQFAKNVQADAKDAYKNMGLSASDYMATANKMGSLFQGSGVEQQKALDMTSKAMKRAADVASVMGVDMNTAMESVAGAAKGNFTMMDNLGVAMNATTLEAYALEKGLNFKWETASNAEKSELAMQMFMDRTKQYDGNFLKESEKTVAGSLDAMKGAFQNFVAGLGNPEADVAELMGNLQTTIQNFAKNIGRVVKTIWDNLPLAPWQKWIAAIAVGAGPVLLAVSGIMKGIGTLKAAFQGIGAVLTNPWGLALVALVALVAGFVHAYKNSEKFRNIVNSAVSAVVTKFNELKAKAQPALDFIKQALSKLNIDAFTPLIGGIGLAIVAINKLKAVKIPNPFSKLKFNFPKIPNPFTGLANMAKSAGAAIKSAFSGLGKGIGAVFKGIGTAISTVFQGIARAISMLNPAGVASFALGLAAVTAALVALSAVQGMVLPFLQGLADIFVNLVGGVLQAFVSALVALAPVMTTIASALALLSPLVVAFGIAFSSVVVAIGTAVSSIITAVTPLITNLATIFQNIVTVIVQAIVQIVQALAPHIPTITQMFSTIAQVIATAVVQIVQALAPFIPAVTEMVTALAPVLSEIAQAFTTLIEQVSPIIDSLTNMLKTFGQQVSSILRSAGSVVESFGSAIRNVLDGVAGIFDSIGNAAKNAGMGVKLMAQGLKILVDLKLGDLIGTLAAVATGLTAIAGSGIVTAGPGLLAAGQGLMLIATSGQTAQLALTTLPATISSFVTSLSGIQPILVTGAAAIQTFANSAKASMAGLIGANAQIAGFTSMIVTIASAANVAESGLSSFNANANRTSSILGTLGTRAIAAGSQMTTFGAMVTSAMSTAQSAVTSGGTQMVVAMQSAVNKMKSVVLNGFTSISSTIRSQTTNMVTAFRSSISQMPIAAQTSVNQVRTALMALGSISLTAQGQAVLQSFMSGMQSQWVATRSWVKEVAAWIDKNKGPISYDRKLLVPHGNAVMDGFLGGLKDGFSQVQRFVSSLAGTISYDMSGLSNSIATGMMLDDFQASILGNMSISAMPATVSHSLERSSSDSSILNRILEAILEGQLIYLDGRLVASTVDRRLGQQTKLGERTAW